MSENVRSTKIVSTSTSEFFRNIPIFAKSSQLEPVRLNEKRLAAVDVLGDREGEAPAEPNYGETLWLGGSLALPNMPKSRRPELKDRHDRSRSSRRHRSA